MHVCVRAESVCVREGVYERELVCVLAVYERACVCVCVCVCERERGGASCVCMCV